MARLFSDSFRESSIFRSQRALLPDYAPAELVHRDSQLEEIAGALKPALTLAQPHNLFVHGGTGTGKTSSVKFVFHELLEYAQKVACVHVNCWQNSSRQSVLSKLAEHFQEPIPRRGLSNEEILHRLVGRLKYDKKALIVCLDEADRLFHRGEEEVLYDLSRLSENHGIACGVVAISNNADILALLDDRMRSSLRFKSMEFKQYSPTELKDILKERAKEAFLPGACPEEVIALCAAHGAKSKGDARIAIEALLAAGRLADSAGRSKMELQDARKAVGSESQATLDKNLAYMSGNEKTITELLKKAKVEGKKMTASQLLEEFNRVKQKTGEPQVGERQFRNYVQVFEDAGLIETEIAPDPETQKGKTKIIKMIK